MAQTLYTVLNDRGIHIGRDIAVTGFDDLHFAANSNRPLHRSVQMHTSWA